MDAIFLKLDNIKGESQVEGFERSDRDHVL